MIKTRFMGYSLQFFLYPFAITPAFLTAAKQRFCENPGMANTVIWAITKAVKMTGMVRR